MSTTSPQTDQTGRRRPRRRTVARITGIAIGVLGIAAAGTYIWLDHTSDVRNTGVAECTDVIPDGGGAEQLRGACSAIDAMTAAWNRNDADAYGAAFTENATYTTFLGTHYTGRSDITESHRALFSGFLKGSKLVDSFLDVRFYGDDVAIITSRGDRYDDEPPTRLSKIQTYTVVQQTDGQWRIAAFHNTQRRTVMERISFLFDPATQPRAER